MQVYAVLTNADNTGIFRAFGCLVSFKVVHESADEVNVLAEQIAMGGLAGMKRKVPLSISGSVFPKALTGEYHLTRSGLMKRYEVSSTSSTCSIPCSKLMQCHAACWPAQHHQHMHSHIRRVYA